GRIALGHPAGDPLVEDEHVPVPREIEDFVGRPGQLVGTGSVEDDEILTVDIAEALGQVAEADVPRPRDLHLAELLRYPDVHEDDTLLEVEERLHLVHRDVALGHFGVAARRGAEGEEGEGGKAGGERARHWKSSTQTRSPGWTSPR